MKKKISIYLKKILKSYPKIASGRKNHDAAELRVKKNIYLTKKYFKKN
tara:strand:- start:2799 stop:2942 length:144 start_codon:yes stop_codon:yes gene_type:complete